MTRDFPFISSLVQTDWGQLSEPEECLKFSERYRGRSRQDPLSKPEWSQWHSSTQKNEAVFLENFLKSFLAKKKKDNEDNLFEERLKKLEQIVRVQGEAIAVLQEQVHLPAPGPFETWIDSEDASQFSNKHIAYLEGSGVIASADTLDEVSAAIAGHPQANEIILDFVYRASI